MSKTVIKKNESKGMLVPVTIYADENLISKMALDKVNNSLLLGRPNQELDQ